MAALAILLCDVMWFWLSIWGQHAAERHGCNMVKNAHKGLQADIKIAQATTTCLGCTAGVEAPEYLDGGLAGDYGWDPLGLGANPDRLNW